MLERKLTLSLLASLVLHAELLAILSEPLAGNAVRSAPPGPRQTLHARLASGEEPARRPEPGRGQAEPWPTASPQPASPIDGRTRQGWNAYLPAELLDEKPAVIADIPIDPPELRNHPQGGEIVLSIWIGSDGAVEDVTVEENSLPAVFAESAARGFRSAKFRPGRKAGVPVKSRMRVAVSYLPLAPAGGPVRAAGEK